MLTIKITKINNLKIYETGYIRSTAVHFKVDGKDYFLHYTGAEYEDVLTLYKGRNKGHLTRIASCWGDLDNFIKFTRKPGCLKYVDINNFVNKLKENGLWKGELELL